MPRYLNSMALAYELDYVQQLSIDNVMPGWFSQMDGQMLKLLNAYPQLISAHENFSQARQEIWPARITDESWEEMKRAAQELAAAMRSLGDIDIALCERPTGYSSFCGCALMPAGTCAFDQHSDS